MAQNDPEYYNVLPSSVPPDVPTKPAPGPPPRRPGGAEGSLPPLPAPRWSAAGAVPRRPSGAEGGLPADRDSNLVNLTAASAAAVATAAAAANDDPEYCNGLPSKVPPDVSTKPAPGPPPRRPVHAEGGLPPLPAPRWLAAGVVSRWPGGLPPLPAPRWSAAGAVPRRPGGAEGGLAADRDSSLMDLTAAAASAAAASAAATGAAAATAAAVAAAVRGAATTALRSPTPRSQAEHTRTLSGHSWYHGTMSRRSAEALLGRDGDFLVRKSDGALGQFVLTGLQNGINKHLLLVDPDGVVRTRDRTYDSMVHLVNFYKDYQLPILSAETALTLRNPVPRR